MTYYTVHHNWEWVVTDVITREKFLSGPTIKCKRMRDLPSERRVKSTYALFRVETGSSRVWCCSRGLEFLDAKDTFFEQLAAAGVQHTMPPTILIPWDLIDASSLLSSLPTVPSLLKAACGSGGFGIYCVFSVSDINKIIAAHAKKAQLDPAFIERLRRDFRGEVPRWSLQAFVNSVKVKDGKYRCQVRAYIVLLGESLFLFKDFEVRIPSWGKESLDEILESHIKEGDDFPVENLLATGKQSDSSTDSVETFERDCVAGTGGRPYNRGRLKVKTGRFMLSELPEIADQREAVAGTVTEAFTAIRPAVLAELHTINKDRLDKTDVATEMAIAGVDLMLEEVNESSQFRGSGTLIRPRILELNNNPAMPGQQKDMSEKYLQHLNTFVGSVINLGLSKGHDCHLFTRLW